MKLVIEVKYINRIESLILLLNRSDFPKPNRFINIELLKNYIQLLILLNTFN